MATIISGYGVNKTPNQLSGWNGGNCNGDRSDFSTIGKCSYKENKSPTASAMKTALKNGHTLMIHIEGKTLKTDNGSNSYSGHWVVVLDYKTTNNKDKIYIHNPWKGNACGWADLNTVASALSEYIDVWK